MTWETITHEDLLKPDLCTEYRAWMHKSGAANLDLIGANKAEDGWRFIIRVFTDDGRDYVLESIWTKDNKQHHAVARWVQDDLGANDD